MDHTKQAIQNEFHHGNNIAIPAQPNPTPLGPPPMVLQNPLPPQGMVPTTPSPQPNPIALAALLPTKIGVHHLLAMKTKEVNL